ncbi:MAG: hypothetical protein OEY22_08660 [Candidatus Bathyarchaeota archaeon]|nr:hypothetical protein [Candidatus Bathyarchaeota archaeon]MDH5787468.1 hypothetical protein [Candidatus Bathyarchaeota archaeon]
MAKLSSFFGLIRDNSWHTIKEISETLDIPSNRLSEMSKLLSEHDLIEYEQDKERVKINAEWKIICEQYDEIEEKQSVATIIVPPEKDVRLQNTTIANLTDMPLELNVRINGNLKEVTINKIS